jgi:hypothetical protein
MSLDLAEWSLRRSRRGLVFREVLDEDDARTYTELTRRYWQIPDQDQPLDAELHRPWDRPRSPGRRYPGLRRRARIREGYRSLGGPLAVAAISGMSVRPEARGRSVCHEPDDSAAATRPRRGLRDGGPGLHPRGSQPLYRRAGFVRRSALTIFATAPLWSRSH